MSDLGARLRAARAEAGVSLSALARRTHYSKAMLGHLETGKRPVHPDHVTAYSRALGIAIDRLYGPTEDPLRVAHKWLVADTPAAVHARAGRRIGESLVSDLERRAIDLRHLDDTIGGTDLLPLVNRELGDVERLTRESSYSSRVGTRLLTVLGELAQLGGWVASDAGRYAEAQRIYLSGVHASREAGDDALTGQLLSSLSYQMANVGDPSDAALLARSAIRGADHAAPTVRALLLERLAWASARSCDDRETRRVLDAVDDAFSSRSPGIEEPEWVYWMNRNEIDIMAGRCLIELGDPIAAEPLLTSAINSYPAEHAREVTLYRTWLAESYARAGIVDAATETIAGARRAARGLGSVRLDVRIRNVESLIAA